MTDAVLALNAGSSSIKFSVYAIDAAAHTSGDGPVLRCSGEVESIGHDARLTVRDAAGKRLAAVQLGTAATQESALSAVRAWIADNLPDLSISAAGHRVVHGGDDFAGPVRIDRGVLAALRRFIPLAPSHQPHNLAAIEALAAQHPDLPQVACFDTAFHQAQPAVARAFALPRTLSATGVRRYGFHGLSYEYIAGVLPDFAGAPAYGRVVVAHLGHGASMCALRGRRSVATTMGFTALDGLPMGQRCGALDPGVIPYLVRERGMAIGDVEDLLYHHSGLLGVSGISDDMRDLLASDRPEAAEAVELFCYRIARELGSLAAALEGLDVLVFTGGIGEHAAAVRAKVCAQARWLGIRLDEEANLRGGPRLTTAGSTPAAFVIPTDEDLMIARHTLQVVRSRTDHAAAARHPREKAG